MNFQQLEYVLAVDQHKHFNLAAESCNITQATLSAMIKKLEEELGVLLFDRSVKPVETSEQGLQFIEYARLVLKLRNQMLLLGQEENYTLEGDLRLGIIPTIASSLLPKVLPSILERYPKLNLQIVEMTTSEMVRKLKSRKLDLGILSTPLYEEGIEEHILYYEAMMLYGKLLNHSEYMSSKEIRNGKIWLLQEDHCFREQSIRVCKMKEYKEVIKNFTYEGNSFDTLMALVDEFGGYTLLPELYVNHLPPGQRKYAKMFRKPIPVREISIVSRSTSAMGHRIQLLSDLIKSKIEAQLQTSSIKARNMEIVGF